MSPPLITGGLAFWLIGFGLFVWYRGVVGLPVRRIPGFARARTFKWGVPALSLLFLVSGLGLLYTSNIVLCLSVLGISSALGTILLRFDKYTAEMKVIYYDYRQIGAANPWMEEAEVLFRTAERRYPGWSEDRLLELAAGKNIESLMLLMMVQENDINPIADWELYRTLKRRAAGVPRSNR